MVTRSVPFWKGGEIAAKEIVDKKDFERVSQYNWRLVIGGKKRMLWYARADIQDSTGKWRAVFLHRFVLGLSKGDPNVDYRNHNGLDNRRENLRLVTQAQNLQNVRSHRDGSSRYRGVSWDRHRKAWRAQVKVNGKHVLDKRFSTEQEAAEAAAEARREFMPFSAADQAA